MTEELSDKGKIELLWRDFEARQRAEEAAKQRAALGETRTTGLRALIDAIDQKTLMVIVAGVVALGQGSDIADRFFQLIETFMGVHK